MSATACLAGRTFGGITNRSGRQSGFVRVFPLTLDQVCLDAAIRDGFNPTPDYIEQVLTNHYFVFDSSSDESGFDPSAGCCSAEGLLGIDNAFLGPPPQVPLASFGVGCSVFTSDCWFDVDFVSSSIFFNSFQV